MDPKYIGGVLTPMRVWFNVLILTTLFCTPRSGWSNPESSWPQGSVPSESDLAVVATSGDVRITVKEHPLFQVLQRIQNESGVHFQISGPSTKQRISTTISAPNWVAAIRKLLVTYNTLEVWDKEKRLRRVLILGKRGELTQPPISFPYSSPTRDPAAHGLRSGQDHPGTADGPPDKSHDTQFTGPPVSEEFLLESGPPRHRAQHDDLGPVGGSTQTPLPLSLPR